MCTKREERNVGRKKEEFAKGKKKRNKFISLGSDVLFKKMSK